MIRIPCPTCGVRDYSEFAYGGDATVVRPDPANTDEGAWTDYVYLRDNPRGRHREYWQHVHGCRQWLIVDRDTVTHEIFRVSPARDSAGRPTGDSP